MIAWSFHWTNVLWLVLVVFFILGVMHALHVLRHVRSSQGAIAWIGGLLVLPVIVVPLYWLAGRTRYHNFVEARKMLREELSEVYDARDGFSETYRFKSDHEIVKSIAKICDTHSTEGNSTTLLINAEAKFNEVFKQLKTAKEYIIVDYFTIKDDEIGRKFKEALIEQAQKGIRVSLVYDDFGSSSMTDGYMKDLKDAGVTLKSFGIKKKWLSRFQLNFRNHRKLIVIDGVQAFIGGINVGDEYLGRDPEIGFWRDTHLHVRGPATLGIQLVAMEDFYWGSEEILEVKWDNDFSIADNKDADEKLTLMPSNPSDDYHTWALAVATAAASAKEKFWISSPYLVPDEGVITALQTAVMRGVDVRILYPKKSDQVLAHYASLTFQGDLIPIGVKLYQYEKGFLHQKVLLVDDSLAMVGTANFDYRSFRLNFEIMVLGESPQLINAVSAMLEEDFSHSTLLEKPELEGKGAWLRVRASFARLFSPIL